MSNRNIIIDSSFGQTRAAIVEDGELTELYVEDNNHTGIVGNIYKGKVVNVFPGMEAAFVDIGTEKNGFLHVSDATIRHEFREDNDLEISEKININDVVKFGQELLVQITKEPVGTKGPRVTVNITLPGRYIVLVPKVDYIGISRRIENELERERLRKAIQKVKPEGFGIIVRTAAEGLEEENFADDINFLLKLWDKIKTRAESSYAPKLIHKDLSLIYRIVRDTFTQDIDKLIINDKEEYNKILEFAEMISPAIKHRIELYSRSYNMFDFYNIQSKIEKALAKKVWLKSGGYLIIEQTEALTVIDVNTGKFVGNKNLEETIVKTNLEAAKEIAKQLRLRDIGGIIVIDFIDMLEPEHQNKVLEELRVYLKKDRTKTNVVGLSQLGLVEMTRKKVRINLSSALQMECPCCEGRGKVASPGELAREIERKVDSLFRDHLAGGVVVEAHPLVMKELMGNADERITDMRKRYNKSIVIKQKYSQNIEDFDVKGVDNTYFMC